MPRFREGGSSAERPPRCSSAEGRFGESRVNGVVRQGAPFTAHARSNKGGTARTRPFEGSVFFYERGGCALTWLNGLFSGSPLDVSRFRPGGLAVMLAGLVMTLLADKIAKRCKGKNVDIALRLGGMLLVMAGALLTMKII